MSRNGVIALVDSSAPAGTADPHRFDGRNNRRHELRPTASHHGVDGNRLDRRRTATRRYDRDNLIGWRPDAATNCFTFSGTAGMIGRPSVQPCRTVLVDRVMSATTDSASTSEKTCATGIFLSTGNEARTGRGRCSRRRLNAAFDFGGWKR
jgi:hypothetical protein